MDTIQRTDRLDRSTAQPDQLDNFYASTDDEMSPWTPVVHSALGWTNRELEALHRWEDDGGRAA